MGEREEASSASGGGPRTMTGSSPHSAGCPYCGCRCVTSAVSSVPSNAPSPREPSLQERVRLNVGGRVFETARATLLKTNSRFFADLLSTKSAGALDSTGGTLFFIDRSGYLFEFVLEFLRSGRLLCPRKPWLLSALLAESAHYDCPALARAIHSLRRALEGGEFRWAEEGGSESSPAPPSLTSARQTPSHEFFFPPLETTLSPRSAAVSAPVLGASRVEGSWSAKVKEASFKREAPPPSASQAAKEGDGVLEEGTLAEEADCQEGAALDSLEILKNSAAAAEEVRRWLVNDDPEPPEPPRCALDLGAKVLSVDEDF